MKLHEVLSDDLVFSMIIKLIDAGKDITFDHVERSLGVNRVHHGKLIDIIQHGDVGVSPMLYTVVYQGSPTRIDTAKLKPEIFAKLKLQRWGDERVLSDREPQLGDDL